MIIMLMISMWNSGGSSARCLPVWNCCLLLSPGEIDDCDDWSSSLYDQGILPWQKADLTDPYFSEFCSWRSKRNGKVIIDQDLDIDWEWGLCRRWETWCCNYHCHFHHQHRHDHYHFKNHDLYHHQVPRNFKAMTSRAQKLFRKLLDPEPEKRLQVFHFLEKRCQKAKRPKGCRYFLEKKMPKPNLQYGRLQQTWACYYSVRNNTSLSLCQAFNIDVLKLYRLKINYKS